MALPINPSPNEVVKTIKDLQTEKLSTNLGVSYANKLLVTDVDGDIAVVSPLATLDSSSTDTQIPSAKCVYDLVGDIESLLSEV